MNTFLLLQSIKMAIMINSLKFTVESRFSLIQSKTKEDYIAVEKCSVSVKLVYSPKSVGVCLYYNQDPSDPGFLKMESTLLKIVLELKCLKLGPTRLGPGLGLAYS